jgi:DnaJ-class molecular chaperone
MSNEILINNYNVAVPNVWAKGSKYGRLQTDGFNYLCPECGGYGTVPPDQTKCDFCDGKETIPLDDKRIVSGDPR